LKIYIVFDDACPVWNSVCGVFKDKEAALKCLNENAGSNDTWISDEERWESPYHTSVFIIEEELK
jgi:hypothetical protein